MEAFKAGTEPGIAIGPEASRPVSDENAATSTPSEIEGTGGLY
jgi:hypothetical protein